MTIMSRRLYGVGAFGMSEPLISPAMAPLVGGVVSALATLGLRMIVDPVSEGKVSQVWRWAPAIGAGVGAVVGGGASYFLGNEDWMSALGAAGGAVLASGPLLAQEVYHRSVQKDAIAGNAEAMTKWTAIQMALAPDATTPAGLPAGTPAAAQANGVGNVPRAWGTNPMYANMQQ